MPRSWRIAWALAVTQTVGYGVLYYSFSVMTLPMEGELGWTRGEISGAFSLALLLAGLAAVPVGRLVDARGARGLMALGSGLGALTLLMWSFADNLAAFYLAQAGLGLAMALTLYEVAFTVIAGWFRERAERTRAMLLITVVAGLASTIFVPLATLLVEAVGWRAALRVLALILALTALPLHVLVVRRPVSAPQRTRDVRLGDAVRAPTFWWLACAFALDNLATAAVAAHSVPLLSERLASPALVAAAVGSIGLMQVAGRVLFTPLVASVPLHVLSAATFSCRALALVVLLALPTWGVWPFVALFGAANGASTLAKAGLVAEVYGAAHYGSVNGAVATFTTLSRAAAPLAAGVLFDLTGDYTILLFTLMLCTTGAALAVTRVRPKHAPG